MDTPKVILLSGEICAGKSTLARWLVDTFGFKYIKTSDLLKNRVSSPSPTRTELQELGQSLDATDPAWLIDAFFEAARIDSQPNSTKFLSLFTSDHALQKVSDAFSIAATVDELRHIVNDICRLTSEKVMTDIIKAFSLPLSATELGKLVRELCQTTATHDLQYTYVVDSIRVHKQAELFRDYYGHNVVHIHLEAPADTLESRFLERESPSLAGDYKEVKSHETEVNVKLLDSVADISIDTARCRPEDVQARAAGLLRLFGQATAQLVDVIVGGQYGSEGKGNISSHICKEYQYLVRVGGPNAGHKIKNSLQETFTFRQMPSGAEVNDKAILVIGPGATIDVDVLLEEVMTHEVGYDRLRIDPFAVVIDQKDKDFEREYLRNKIASTGSGSGHAAAMRILDRRIDVDSNPRLAQNCQKLKPYIEKTYDILDTAYRNKEKILLEGTQGTGLSIFHGIYPYVTSRDTTVAGCLSEAGISPARVRKTIMVCRTYPIRVGNPEEGGFSGPMAIEVERSELKRRSKLPLRELKEISSVSKKPRRISEFDWDLFRKTVALNTPTDIALTFVDYLSKKNRDAYRYDQLTSETINFIEEIERIACAPVSLISTKFDFRSVIDRRNWR